jgi:hypothetical protein
MAKSKGGANAKFGLKSGKGAPSSTVQVKPTYQHDVVEWLKQEADRNALAVKLGRTKTKSKFAPKSSL